MRAWLNESLTGTKLQKCTTILACIILFLAPHKFGNNVSSTVFSFFPRSVLDALTHAWPLSWVPLFCGTLLVLALAANHGRIRLKRTQFVWSPLLFLLMACIPGWIFAATTFVPMGFTLHVVSWLAFACALAIHTSACPKSRNLMYAAIFVGVILLCLQVVIEYFVTLPMNLEYLQNQIQLYGAEAVPARMMTLISGNRPQANFAITNSLAAHLILVIPLFAALGIRWGRHVDPPEAATRILPVVLVAFPLFCLYTTKSRAGILAFCIGIIVAGLAFVVSSPATRKRYGRLALTALGIAPFVILGAYLALRSGRGTSSMLARFDYWEYATKMFLERPLTGCGLGEFFHNYLRLKPAEAEIARQPHSMFFLMLSSCGIGGAFAALTVIVSPALIWNCVRKGTLAVESKTVYYFSLAGVVSWMVHAQADFDVHVPATVLTMTALMILPLSLNADENEPVDARQPLLTALLDLLALGCLVTVTRIPGDYHLARLETFLDGREDARYKGQFVVSLEAAVPLAKEAAKAMPGCPLPWEKVGVAAMREKRFPLAVTAYRHVTAINPHFAAGHYRLAEALYRLGMVDEARKSFEMGKAWHPNNPEQDRLEAELFPDKKTSSSSPESTEKSNQ